MWNGMLNRWVLAVLCICAVVAAVESAQVIYVDDDASAGGSGVSWADACKDLQDALVIAAAADKPVEIRVAQGVYKPDQGAGITPGDQTATFKLLNGVTLKGGYAGTGAQDPNAWDSEQYETVLSGDLKSDDVDVNYPSDLLRFYNEPTRVDNSLHVVTGSGTDETAVLDGFVITAGWGSWSTVMRLSSNVASGGGMLNDSGSPTVLRCLFRDNFSTSTGGAVYNYSGSPLFSDCLFHRNAVGFDGGAMYSMNSNPVVTDCTFEGNAADDLGGAIANDWNSFALLRGCTFKNNQAGTGGALYNGAECTADMKDCTFEANRATVGIVISGGGAIAGRADIVVTQCVFRQNSAARTGGAIYADGSMLHVSDCSFSANTVDPQTTTTDGGGAIHLEWNTIAEIENSVFEGNSAPNGGAVCSQHHTYAKILGCRFKGNTASTPNVGNFSYAGGGAILAFHSIMKLAGCDFQGNRALGDGGAVRGEITARLALTNCLFAGNRAERGGGICASDVFGVDLRLENCTLASNVAVDGSALVGWGALEHCIVWDGNTLVSDRNTTITAIYCDIQGGYPGQGNIDADPLFVRPGYWADANDLNVANTPDDPNAVWVAGDYHLQSQAGHWDREGEQWVADAMTSPCIDTGDMGIPIGDEPFPNGGILNLGAYGGTPEASRSHFGEPVCETQIPDDINGDCKVDSVDAQLAAQDWRVSGTPAENQPPTIVITQPADGSVIEVSPSNPSIPIFADVSDVDGSVVELMFSVEQKTENSLLRSSFGDVDGSDGWGSNWMFLEAAHPFPAGSYTITAYAIDDGCEIAFAPEVHVTITIAE